MRFLMLLVLLMAASPVQADITIDLGDRPLTLTPTDIDKAAIQRRTGKVNRQIAEQDAAWNAAHPLTPPRVTPRVTQEQYVRDALVSVVQAWVREMHAANAQTACETYRALPAAKQDVIKAELGGKAPCE